MCGSLQATESQHCPGFVGQQRKGSGADARNRNLESILRAGGGGGCAGAAAAVPQPPPQLQPEALQINKQKRRPKSS